MDEIIIRYIEGTATEEEKKQLLEWLEKSADNQKLFSEMQSVWLASMATFGNEHEDAMALERLQKRIHKDREQQKAALRSKLFKLGMRVVDVAAVLILAIGMYFLFKAQPKEELTQQASMVINKVIMPEGCKGKFVLPDGSVAWLNAGSVLSFPEQFETTERRVRIEGEAYFSVVENKASPFIVQTNGLDITVLGTQFDVLSYASHPSIETAVVSGSVKVRPQHGSKDFVLKPNQKLSYSPNDSLVSIENVNALYLTNWINNRLVFDNDRLSDIFVSLERWYNIKLNCHDPKLKNIRITFTIRNESKEEILKLIKRIAPINYRVRNNEITITSSI